MAAEPAHGRAPPRARTASCSKEPRCAATRAASPVARSSTCASASLASPSRLLTQCNQMSRPPRDISTTRAEEGFRPIGASPVAWTVASATRSATRSPTRLPTGSSGLAATLRHLRDAIRRCAEPGDRRYLGASAGTRRNEHRCTDGAVYHSVEAMFWRAVLCVMPSADRRIGRAGRAVLRVRRHPRPRHLGRRGYRRACPAAVGDTHLFAVHRAVASLQCEDPQTHCPKRRAR
jgi:hypothetical protein